MLRSKTHPFPELLTARLKLRALEAADLEWLFQLRSDPLVAKFTGRKLDQNKKATESYYHKIQAGIKNNQWIYWAIQQKDSKALIGTICLWNFDEEKQRADLGYELLPAFQKKGLMTEAVQAVVPFSFNFLGLKQLFAVTNPANIASCKLLEKSGFEQDFSFKEADLDEQGKEIPLTLFIRTDSN
ncbi:GNAT family N-acetyltransferase [Listeria costaricensis]|uniref:GNAT family N-acetyltransferase n=1 Tax=Listeria costaricensis TaxID=2026604 RepID=UPI000C07B69E|nr:GNAT family N-acetyltransferase [Listeria costaricensis]